VEAKPLDCGSLLPLSVLAALLPGIGTRVDYRIK
jgi:hypothetical protein